MSFQDLLHTVGDAASSAVHVSQALAAAGTIPDEPDAKKGKAVEWALTIVNAALEARGGRIFEPIVDGLVERAIEAALAEVKELASRLPGGFAGVVAGLVQAVAWCQPPATI